MIKGFSGVSLVGMTGFEPAAFYSRSKRATKLRHIPICLLLKRA